MTDQRTGPSHGRFHVHVHRPRTSPEVAAAVTDETVILDPFSGRPWLSGRWPRRTVRQVDTDALRVVLIGACGLPERALAEQVIRSADRYDPGALARLPGSFLTFVRTPYGSYAAGDVAGLHRLRLAGGELASSPHGGAAVPEASGVHLYDDGAHRLEPYWAPPRADTPAAVTGPLLAQRLRTAVLSRASMLGATVDADDAARRLLDGHAVSLDSPRGPLTLLPTGVESLRPPGRQTRRRLSVDRRLRAARASAATAFVDPDPGCLLHLPLLDAHVLQVALATRPADLSRDRLHAEAAQALDPMTGTRKSAASDNPRRPAVRTMVVSRDTSRAANGYGGASLTDGTRARCRRAAARPMRGIHPPKMRSVVESTYHVLGMSCDHCVQSVTAALSALPGVREVTVDLAAALVTVRSDIPPSADAVRRAVDEAGFELTGDRP